MRQAISEHYDAQKVAAEIENLPSEAHEDYFEPEELEEAEWRPNNTINLKLTSRSSLAPSPSTWNRLNCSESPGWLSA